MSDDVKLSPLQQAALSTAELWCIAPGHARASSIERPPRPKPLHPYALVEIIGALTKPRMVELRQQIARAAASDEIGEIVLLVDSPGGTVAGTHDLFQTVTAAAKRKRVVAVVEDLACSGALYAVCGATEIVIGETAVTGSIGVFQVIVDESKLLEKIGVEIIVVRAGEHKGAGVGGIKLTSEQLGEVKRRVDTQARHFIVAIAAGRRMSVEKVKDLADGRVFIGREAIAAGLADRVGMFEDVIAESEQRTTRLMYRELRGPAAVRQLDELVAGEQRMTGAGAGECQSRIAARYTCLAAAANDHNQAEAAVAAARKAELERQNARWAERKKTMANTTQRGVPPIGGGAGGEGENHWGGSPNEFMKLEIEKLVDKGMPRDRAATSVFCAHPGLREAVVAEANP